LLLLLLVLMMLTSVLMFGGFDGRDWVWGYGVFEGGSARIALDLQVAFSRWSDTFPALDFLFYH
jgi:hypothetical protein